MLAKCQCHSRLSKHYFSLACKITRRYKKRYKMTQPYVRWGFLVRITRVIIQGYFPGISCDVILPYFLTLSLSLRRYTLGHLIWQVA